jgi:hypothetical protein
MPTQTARKKILVVIPHFFKGILDKIALYGSEDSNNFEVRHAIVNSCFENVKSTLGNLDLDYEIFTIGNKGSNLLDIDIEVSSDNPRFIPWAAFDYAYEISSEFDFVLVLEDDILVSENTIQELISFNSDQNASEYILIPNRLETIDEVQFCTDMIAMPGWKSAGINIKGKLYRESINIHSGVLLLSVSKFNAAYEARPFKVPTIIIGGYMASAFANMHAYFRILRALPTSTEMPVIHTDSWVMRQLSINPSISHNFTHSLKYEDKD